VAETLKEKNQMKKPILTLEDAKDAVAEILKNARTPIRFRGIPKVLEDLQEELANRATVRARSKGRYVADDPSTPDIDESREPVTAKSKRARKAPTQKKVAKKAAKRKS